MCRRFDMENNPQFDQETQSSFSSRDMGNFKVETPSAISTNGEKKQENFDFASLESIYRKDYKWSEQPRIAKIEAILAEMTFPRTVDQQIKNELRKVETKHLQTFFEIEKKDLLSAQIFDSFRLKAQKLSADFLEIRQATGDHENGDKILQFYIKIQDLYQRWQNNIKEYFRNKKEKILLDYKQRPNDIAKNLMIKIKERSLYAPTAQSSGKVFNEIKLYNSEYSNSPWGTRSSIKFKIDPKTEIIEELNYMENIGDGEDDLTRQIFEIFPQIIIDKYADKFNTDMTAFEYGAEMNSIYERRGVKAILHHHDYGGRMYQINLDTRDMNNDEIESLLTAIIAAVQDFLPKRADVEKNWPDKKTPQNFT